MMNSEYDNEMTGVLFPNDYRTTDAHPTHTGNCQINGKEWRMAAWRNSNEKRQWLNIKFTEPITKEGEPSKSQTAPATQGASDPF